MKIYSVLDNINKIKGKKVILRLDLNVPLVNGKITNDFKLKCALPTINLLRRSGCSIIIVTHLGEPQLPLGALAASKYSVKPLAKWLSQRLNLPVRVLDNDWSNIRSLTKKMASGELMMLENIRLFKGELDDSKILAKNLAALAEVYVNDAFAVCHRQHASVSAVKDFLPSYAGPLLTTEITNLEKAKTGKRPLILIMGGAKLATKLPLLRNLSPKASMVLTGGGIANTILKSQGQELGNSLFDQSAILAYSQAKLTNVLAPIDVAVLNHGQRFIRSLKEIKVSDTILDIGPQTIKLYGTYIAKAKTIIWNGPMGLFEKPAFAKGNKAIASLVAKATNNKAFTLIGGGETVAALSKIKNNFSWVSTGGGATLSYLEGRILPGLTKLIR